MGICCQSKKKVNPGGEVSMHELSRMNFDQIEATGGDALLKIYEEKEMNKFSGSAGG